MKIDMFAEWSMLWLLKENLRDEICWLLMADAVDGEQKINARSWFEAMRFTGVRELCSLEKRRGWRSVPERDP